jgi:hypothetical protein
MIQLVETDSGKAVRVNGAAAEVTMFFCFWQSALWPKWTEYLSERIQQKDRVAAESRMVIESIKNGRPIFLSDADNTVFEKAREIATQCCRNVGIEVVDHGNVK